MSSIQDSPFYRVTAKALIYDQHGRLLLLQTTNRNWELPGGGWEHDESFETCLKREIREELGVNTTEIGSISFMYRGTNRKRGYKTLRIVCPVTLASHTFIHGDGMQHAVFVHRDQFLELDLKANEGNVADYVDLIWPRTNA